MRRWPQWVLPDDVTAIYQDTGLVMASRANSVHRRLALDHGALVLVGACPVEAIREVGGEVEVVAGGRTYRAGSLVVAAGAWTNRAVGHLGVRFPLDVTLEHVVYTIAADPSRFHPSWFPVWIRMDEPCFYGFPIFGNWP